MRVASQRHLVILLVPKNDIEAIRLDFIRVVDGFVTISVEIVEDIKTPIDKQEVAGSPEYLGLRLQIGFLHGFSRLFHHHFLTVTDIYTLLQRAIHLAASERVHT